MLQIYRNHSHRVKIIVLFIYNDTSNTSTGHHDLIVSQNLVHKIDSSYKYSDIIAHCHGQLSVNYNEQYL